MNTQKEQWEELYAKVEPLVEKMKAKYPPEINIEGLEPALSADITEIVASLLSSQRETLAVGVESLKGWEVDFEELLRDFLVQQLAWEKTRSEKILGRLADAVDTVFLEDGSPVLQEMAEKRFTKLKNFMRSLLSLQKETLATDIEAKKYINVRDTSNNVSDDPDYEALHQESYNSGLTDAAAHIRNSK